MTSEKFNLTWNEFEQSTSNAFKDLLDQQDFVDVTLVCEDSKEIKCHKVVLSACSPVFKSILLRNPHQHPLLYLSGVQHIELKSLVSFMYLGQTEVAQNDLNNFMAVASKFQIKGLSGEQKDTDRNEVLSNEPEYKPMVFEDNEDLLNQQQHHSSLPVANLNDTSDYLEDYPAYEDSNFMTNSGNLSLNEGEFKCEKCEYKSKQKCHVKTHMRAQHEVVRYSCDYCDYKTGYTHNLKKHSRNKHAA